MNTKEFEREFEKRWWEYERLRDVGETYAALLRISELENCLEKVFSREGMYRDWRAAIRETHLSAREIARVRAGAKATANRLWKIVSTGTDFVYEELVLLLTLRVQLELVLEFLARRNITCIASDRVAPTDEEISAIASSRRHRAAFSDAQIAVARHWGLPLRARWLLTPD